MKDDELLDEMLVELERRRRAGEPVTAEEVSREHPHLLEALRKRIEERLLGALVERYEQAMARGETPDLETLCRDHPHLQEPLRRRIDKRILQRLATRYEQLVSEGKTPAIGELCRNHPHLEASLREMIAALDEMQWLDNLASWDGELASWDGDRASWDGDRVPSDEAVGPAGDTVRDAQAGPHEPISLEQFTSRLESSGLLHDRARKDRLDQLLQQSAAWTALTLAQQLLAEKLLTDYQCEMLFSRKAPLLTFGTYELTEEIGKGGMGRVYRCRHGLLGRTYALKVLKVESLDSDTRRRRFLREIRATGKLDHPNVVGAFFADEQDGKLYLIMPLVQDDLEKVLKRKGRLSVLETLRYIRQAAQGLEYAHQQQVLHRDIKPGNMLVDADGRLRIADFGLARLRERDSESVTLEGRGGGTGPYMAPEQALDMASADERSDIYSLGCTLYRLLTGEFLCTPAGSSDSLVAWYEAHLKSPIPDLRQRVPQAPAALQAVFRRMVAKRPQDRYSSATELVADLERLERDVARRGGAGTRLPRLPALQPRTAIPAALFALLLVLLVLAFWSGVPLPFLRSHASRLQRYNELQARSATAWQQARDASSPDEALSLLNESIAHHRAAEELAAEHGMAETGAGLNDQELATALRRRARIHFDNADFERARNDFEQANALNAVASSPEDDYRHARILLSQCRAEPSASLKETLVRLARRLPENSSDVVQLRGWANLHLETLRLLRDPDEQFVRRGLAMFSNVIRTASPADRRDHSARLELRLMLPESENPPSIAEAYEMLRDAARGEPPAERRDVFSRRLAACYRRRARFLLTYGKAALRISLPLANSLPAVHFVAREKDAAAASLVRQAIADLRRALREEGDERRRAAALTDLGIAHLHLGDYTAALESLDEAARLHTSARCRYHRAVARSERVADTLQGLPSAQQAAPPEAVVTELQAILEDLDPLLAQGPRDSRPGVDLWRANALYMRAFTHSLLGDDRGDRVREDLMTAAERGHGMAVYRLALLRYEASDFAGSARLMRQLRLRPSLSWSEPAIEDDILWFLAQCRRQRAVSIVPPRENQADLIPQLVEARRQLVLAIQVFYWSGLPDASRDAEELLDKLADWRDLEAEIQAKSQEFGVPELHRQLVRQQWKPRSEGIRAWESRPGGLIDTLEQLRSGPPDNEAKLALLRTLSGELASHPESAVRNSRSALQLALRAEGPWVGLGRAAAISSGRRVRSLVEDLVRPASPWARRTESPATRGYRAVRAVLASQFDFAAPLLRAAGFPGRHWLRVLLLAEPCRAGPLDLLLLLTSCGV